LKTKTKPDLVSCSCCGVFFRSDVCPQCYVAGCIHRGKGKPCRLTASARGLQEMPELQVREAYARLLDEHKKLTEEAQRLVRIIYAKDPALLEQFRSPEVRHAIPGQILNAEFPPQPAEMYTYPHPLAGSYKSRGEIQHG
jgi:hypothetical protein